MRPRRLRSPLLLTVPSSRLTWVCPYHVSPRKYACGAIACSSCPFRDEDAMSEPELPRNFMKTDPGDQRSSWRVLR